MLVCYENRSEPQHCSYLPLAELPFSTPTDSWRHTPIRGHDRLQYTSVDIWVTFCRMLGLCGDIDVDVIVSSTQLDP